jgi:hypothetical protein
VGDLAAPLMMVAGSGMSIAGDLSSASAQSKELRRQATVLEANAGLARASSQRKAIEEVRAGRLQRSRVQALVAASGAGASDPSVVNDEQYARDVALYEGEMEGRDSEEQARSRRIEARNVKRSALFKAAGTALSAGMTMFDRYGGGGFQKDYYGQANANFRAGMGY